MEQEWAAYSFNCPLLYLHMFSFILYLIPTSSPHIFKTKKDGSKTKQTAAYVEAHSFHQIRMQ